MSTVGVAGDFVIVEAVSPEEAQIVARVFTTVLNHYGVSDGRGVHSHTVHSLDSAALASVAMLWLGSGLGYDDTLKALQRVYPRMSVHGFVVAASFGSETSAETRRAIMEYVAAAVHYCDKTYH